VLDSRRDALGLQTVDPRGRKRAVQMRVLGEAFERSSTQR
jgi:hypothetical protein